jgi:hypothetical protein
MIGSFKQYLVEEEKTIFFSFGRMNPPTIGHEKLLDKLASTAGRNPYRMYLSQSQDPKKNPLAYKVKVKAARKMFPRHARNIIMTNDIKTVFDIVVKLYAEGFRKVVMVVGSDRLREFNVLLDKYNGKRARHGFYNFADIKIVSAGDRDPDADGAEGMSASKMRAAASDNDFTSFSQGLPKVFSNSDSKALFNTVRKAMGLKEATDFRNHVQLSSVSETREAYVDGELYSPMQSIVIKESGEVGVVLSLGPNYVIVETTTGKYRKWLDDIEKIDEEYKYEWGTDASVKHAKKTTPGQADEACWDTHKQVGMKKKGNKMVPDCVPKNEKTEVSQDPDIKDKEGSQPAKYHKGIKSKDTKSKRDAHFKKYGKKADDNSGAYKPAPGDATAKTKPSQYTKKFKAMYGEDTDIVKAKIDREKKIDAVRHDRMMDKARIRDAIKKNKETKPND